MAAARLHLHLFPRLRAFASSSRHLLAAHPRAVPLSHTVGPATPLAARARRGFGSSLAARRGRGLRHICRPTVRAASQGRAVPNSVLRARNKRINTFDDNLRSLADEMFDVMYK